MERRDFIKHSAAIASVTAVGGMTEAKPVVSDELHDAQRCSASIVLVDERFSDSRSFGAVFAARGAKVISLAEDIGRLWYGELRAHCVNAGSVIIGLTVHTDLFVSQAFARESGKTCIQFGSHDCRGKRTLTHSIPANASLDLRSSTSWAEEVACAMMRGSSFNAASVLQPSRAVRASDHPGSLYSWMIV